MVNTKKKKKKAFLEVPYLILLSLSTIFIFLFIFSSLRGFCMYFVISGFVLMEFLYLQTCVSLYLYVLLFLLVICLFHPILVYSFFLDAHLYSNEKKRKGTDSCSQIPPLRKLFFNMLSLPHLKGEGMT